MRRVEIGINTVGIIVRWVLWRLKRSSFLKSKDFTIEKIQIFIELTLNNLLLQTTGFFNVAL